MPRPKGVTHGREATYVHGCRCIPCRRAALRAEQDRRERKGRALRADPALAPHGTANTYQTWSCRCEPCTRANTVQGLANRRARWQKVGASK